MFTVQAGCFGICGVNFVQNSVACVVLRGKLWYTIYRMCMCCPVRCGQTKTAEVRLMPQLQCEEIRFPSADGVHTVAASMYTMPGVPVRAVLQLSHGMCEYVQRYCPMAQWYAQRG